MNEQYDYFVLPEIIDSFFCNESKIWCQKFFQAACWAYECFFLLLFVHVSLETLITSK